MSQQSPEDRSIVEALLSATEELSLREVEERTGLDFNTVRKWRSGDWTRMFPVTRRRALAYLRARGLEPVPLEALKPRPPAGSLAEAAIAAAEHDLMRGFLGAPSDEAKVRALFALAGVQRWPMEEVERLRHYAEEKLGSAAAAALTTTEGGR